jgi:hypothetical protein
LRTGLDFDTQNTGIYFVKNRQIVKFENKKMNTTQAPLPKVPSTSVWKQYRLAMILFEFGINGKEQ